MANNETILTQDARDTGALKEAKDKLEKRVDELTWRLDIEKHLRVRLSIPASVQYYSVILLFKYHINVCHLKLATALLATNCNLELNTCQLIIQKCSALHLKCLLKYVNT